jgi:hypothetical protein
MQVALDDRDWDVDIARQCTGSRNERRQTGNTSCRRRSSPPLY